MPQRLLVIGNKRYSSWSLRAWIGVKQLGLPFEEHVANVIEFLRPVQAELGLAPATSAEARD